MKSVSYMFYVSTLSGSAVIANCEITLCWFENNYMKLNTDKCHLIVSGYKHEQIWAKIGNDKIWESSDVKY